MLQAERRIVERATECTVLVEIDQGNGNFNDREPVLHGLHPDLQAAWHSRCRLCQIPPGPTCDRL